MALAYYFRMESVPRTVSREDWYKTWRQVRIHRKQIAATNKAELEAWRANMAKMPKQMKQDMLDRLINPPIALGPYMDR